ncbi:hypothetical protein L6452_09227 [Arctium lappa]|uniref:Uncharacterized protein n=1 Tax=Arctium lappa TaxID=4217 RepID=A0ACB9DKH4_ARCLA|nr:hypothetical protein L6452_09227 [Arctium lappa]
MSRLWWFFSALLLSSVDLSNSDPVIWLHLVCVAETITKEIVKFKHLRALWLNNNPILENWAPLSKLKTLLPFALFFLTHLSLAHIHRTPNFLHQFPSH